MENRIKELRKQMGLRQEDLAQQLGVTRQTINAIENNKYNPTLELADSLLSTLSLLLVPAVFSKTSHCRLPPVGKASQLE